MFNATTQKFTALGLAAVATLAVLGSINLLAMQPEAAPQIADARAADQVVVIVGQRLARG